MKIIIDHSIPALTKEEKDELEAASDAGLIKVANEDPEEFKKAMLGVKTVIMPPGVEADLRAIGMTSDDLVAMLLKAAKASQ